MFVWYKCKACGSNRKVLVPERSQALDIAFWLKEVASPKIASDHAHAAPTCKAETFDLLMPAEKDRILGQSNMKDNQPPPDFWTKK